MMNLRTLFSVVCALVLGGVGTVSAQLPTQFRNGFPGVQPIVKPQPLLPRGVQRVPTSQPNFVILPQQPVLQPNWPVNRFPQPIVDVDYLVYVRSHPREAWSLYGKYDTVRDVLPLKRALLSRGYDVDVIEKVRTPRCR